MYEPTKKCFVCSGINLCADEDFCDKTKFISKLRACVPEVVWRKDYEFCKLCVEQIDSFYDFKNSCVKSYKCLKQELQQNANPLSNNKDHSYFRFSGSQESQKMKDGQKKGKANFSNKKNASFDIIGRSLKEEVITIFTCYICNVTYGAKNELIKHMQDLHVSKPREEVSSGVFLNTEFLDQGNTLSGSNSESETLDQVNAEESRVKRNLPKCIKCKRVYVSKKILNKHLKECNGENFSINNDVVDWYFCNKCDKSFPLKRTLLLHLQTCSGMTNANEDKTNTVFKLTPTPKKSNSRPAYTYSCEVCGKYFESLKITIKHSKEAHGIDEKSAKPYSCDTCSSRFGTSANLIQHQRYHKKTRDQICPFCGKSYITKSDLIVHEYSHYNRRNYKCEECEKAFNTNKGLRTHNLVCHTPPELWKYNCEVCGKSFPMKSGFEQHMKRHRGEKKFSCHLCQKTFICPSEVKKHLAFHSNVKLFKCRLCPKEYKNRKHCQIHQAKVHKIGDIKIPVRAKKFTCHVCGHMFADRHKLDRHMCTHTGIKPFGCDMCEKKFSDKFYLKSHKKTVHGVAVDDPDLVS